MNDRELLETMQKSFESIRESTTDKTQMVDPVDALEFISGPAYMGETPTPFQRIVIKTLYGLWPYYETDIEERRVLDVLEGKWRVRIDYECKVLITNLMLVLGRRSTKSTLMSYLATYAAYTLICRYNPQLYYGIRERHPIFITHVAAAGDQAESVFTLTADNIKKTEFFRPYIDFDKDNSTELRLFTPFDLEINREIHGRNSLKTKGEQKESTRPGSLTIKSITTSGKTKRGDAIYLLMLSEFAHFERAKYDPTDPEDLIMFENPRTDYAVAKGLMPSVADFGEEGKIVMESSPAEKGGEFYHHYCIGGGFEQENFDDSQVEPGYQVIQMATWEARPGFT